MRAGRTPRLAATAAALAALCAACAERPPAVELRVVDAATGQPTPARVEVLDAAGNSYVAGDALAVAGDCGRSPIHNWIGWWARLQMRRALAAEVWNPFTGTTQFYVDGEARLELPAGAYRLRVFKGNEHRVARRDFAVGATGGPSLTVPLERWIEPSAAGWFSADDHLHIARPHPSFDHRIARWMQAEDLDVANLLQMGLARSLHVTPQHGFGEPAVHRLGGTLVASGQENPRTHVLGHAITLGASRWLDRPADYLAYDHLWRLARGAGGISGYAHWGLGGADEGLATWAPERLLDFLEVLGFGAAYYPVWYDLLNLGVRIAPTAGTDYPCGPTLPGRERFYTRVEGTLDYRKWIEAVRRGRTVVTNGPFVELSVGGAGIGDRLELAAPGPVTVAARVRFDPERDEVTRLELVRAGEVVARGAATGAGELSLETSLWIDRTTWLAARAAGHKRGETPVAGVRFLAQALTHLPRRTAERVLEGPHLPRDGDPRPAAAHTAAVWVRVAGSAPLDAQEPARAAARRFLDLLDELEGRFDEQRLETMAGYPGRGDGVGAADLRRGRAGLLASIERARRHYRQLLTSQRREAGGAADRASSGGGAGPG